MLMSIINFCSLESFFFRRIFYCLRKKHNSIVRKTLNYYAMNFFIIM